ncbi:GNAT family N-acetyltransferase [Algoriphagus chordae]|uniref:Acetyltransferase (GNAT) family protein n=1 Tax=Algoriphagus chordae TaxID=237019 RepID=A0A2W7QHV4_9BACT|nr:GNAT family N-acetyltransferase [Algoriphagus chordae]PZX47671.1 Acetyltransferase (GNAT) family protein [Algoriphagus chordae]
MGLLNKLKPFPVDLLLYSCTRNSALSDALNKDFPYQIDFSEADSQFIIKEKGNLIHRSKLFTSSLLLKNFGYKQPYIAIGDCFTDDNYRGQGIYPNVLHHILKKFVSTHDVYMLVAPTNTPSIKGMEKAGLIPLARLRCLKIGPIYLNKNTVKID